MTLAINRADPAQSASIRSAQTKLGDIIGFQGATLIGAIIGGLYRPDRHLLHRQPRKPGAKKIRAANRRATRDK